MTDDKTTSIIRRGNEIKMHLNDDKIAQIKFAELDLPAFVHCEDDLSNENYKVTLFLRFEIVSKVKH